MLIYNLFFAFMVVTEVARGASRIKQFSMVGAIAIIIFIGLRDGVGADWFNYLNIFIASSYLGFFEYLIRTDLSFGSISYAIYHLTGNYHLLNTIVATIFVFGLYKLMSVLPPGAQRVVLIATVLPYLVIVAVPNYTRQACAVGIFCYALYFYFRGRASAALVAAVIAVSFHASAVVALVLIAVATLWTKKRVLYTFLVALIGSLVIVVFSQRIIYKVTFYTEEVIRESAGTYYRLSLYAVPFVVYFLLVRGRLNDYRSRVIFDFSFVLFVLCWPIAYMDTIIGDRLSLYTLPVQAMILARLPSVVAGSIMKMLMVIACVLFSGLQLNAWLEFSVWAKLAWLPYRSALLIE